MLNPIRYRPLLRSQVYLKPQVFRFGIATYSNHLLRNKGFNQQNKKFINIINNKRLLNQFTNASNNGANNATQPLNENTSNEHGKKSTVLRNVLMIVILGLTALIVIQPYNPFPSPVAKELRKALWAERKQDYLKSIGHYINALSIYDQGEIKSNKLSDEYTGIELKIMEMYLQLNMYKEASMVLLELSYRYYNYLNDAILENKKVNYSLLSKLYCRDLRCVIKFVDIQFQHQNVGMNPDSLIRLLQAHLRLADSEVFAKDMTIARELIEESLKNKQNPLEFPIYPSFENMIIDENLSTDKNGFLNINLNNHATSFVFEPFKDELFVAKDLLDALYFQKNDFNKAINNKRMTLTMMAAANSEPGMLMMTQANLGTTYYMRLQQLREEYKYFKENPDKLKEIFLSQDNYDNNSKLFMDHLEQNMDALVENVKTCYNGVLNFTNDTKKKIKYNIKDNYIDSKIAESIVLSKYGLAVLNMNIYEFEENSQVDLQYCKRLLMDAKNLSNELGNADLLTPITTEMKILEELNNNQTA
ncbi:hypothetical protein ACO0OE_001619 [Hanseniaspora uvarum]